MAETCTHGAHSGPCAACYDAAGREMAASLKRLMCDPFGGGHEAQISALRAQLKLAMEALGDLVESAKDAEPELSCPGCGATVTDVDGLCVKHWLADAIHKADTVLHAIPSPTIETKGIDKHKRAEERLKAAAKRWASGDMAAWEELNEAFAEARALQSGEEKEKKNG